MWRRHSGVVAVVAAEVKDDHAQHPVSAMIRRLAGTVWLSGSGLIHVQRLLAVDRAAPQWTSSILHVL
eukprot:1682196-Prorocentrum_lima.AAC.1